jgi:hypothetical protein
MTRTCLALSVLAIAVAPALAKPEIEKIEACYGRLGPVRKTLDFYPYDEVTFRFVVTGAKVDAEGSVDVEVSWTLLDDNGKEVQAKKLPSKGPLALGGDSFPASVSIVIPEPAVAGAYTLKVRVKDNLAGEETGFERKLNLKATQFAIVSPQFFADAARTAPAPAGGLVGQFLHFRLWVIGFDRSQGQIDSEMTVQVLDKARKEMLPKPLRVVAQNNDAKVVKEVPFLDFSGSLALSRVGEYTVRISVTDRNSKKTATFETPLHVTAP